MQGDNVFVAIGSETAEGVVKNEIARRRRRRRLNASSAAGIECGDGRLEHTAVFELFQERAVLVIEDNAGGGLEKNTIVIRDLLETANENAARFVEHLRFAAGRDQRRDLILQILAIN